MMGPLLVGALLTLTALTRGMTIGRTQGQEWKLNVAAVDTNDILRPKKAGKAGGEINTEHFAAWRRTDTSGIQEFGGNDAGVAQQKPADVSFDPDTNAAQEDHDTGSNKGTMSNPVVSVDESEKSPDGREHVPDVQKAKGAKVFGAFKREPYYQNSELSKLEGTEGSQSGKSSITLGNLLGYGRGMVKDQNALVADGSLYSNTVKGSRSDTRTSENPGQEENVEKINQEVLKNGKNQGPHRSDIFHEIGVYNEILSKSRIEGNSQGFPASCTIDQRGLVCDVIYKYLRTVVKADEPERHQNDDSEEKYSLETFYQTRNAEVQNKREWLPEYKGQGNYGPKNDKALVLASFDTLEEKGQGARILESRESVNAETNEEHFKESVALQKDPNYVNFGDEEIAVLYPYYFWDHYYFSNYGGAYHDNNKLARSTTKTTTPPQDGNSRLQHTTHHPTKPGPPQDSSSIYDKRKVGAFDARAPNEMPFGFVLSTHSIEPGKSADDTANVRDTNQDRVSQDIVDVGVSYPTETVAQNVGLKEDSASAYVILHQDRDWETEIMKLLTGPEAATLARDQKDGLSSLRNMFCDRYDFCYYPILLTTGEPLLSQYRHTGHPDWIGHGETGEYDINQQEESTKSAAKITEPPRQPDAATDKSADKVVNDIRVDLDLKSHC